jgi:tetratricopeptide (TPR) repeat protein
LLYASGAALQIPMIHVRFRLRYPVRPHVFGLVWTLVLTAGLWACSGDPAARSLAFLRSGDQYAEQGRHQEAIIQYRNAVQVDPRFGEARLRLAAAYEQAGDSNALPEYVRAADLLHEDVALQLRTGSLLMAAGRASDALARADLVLRHHPDNVEAHVLRGNALGGLNDLNRALSAMEEALRLDPSRGASYVQLGLVEFARGQKAEAEAAFLRALELAPDDISAHLALANFYWSEGRPLETARALDEALLLDPLHPGANRAMAVFCLATGRVVQAERYLTTLANTAQTAEARFALAEYYTAAGRSSEAIALLEAMAADPRTARGATERLARAQAMAGNRAGAHALADQLLALAPGDVAGHLLKSQLYVEETRRDEALQSALAAVAADAGSARAQFALGRLHAARGDVPAAEAAFREVLRLNPGATAAQVELSRLQLAGGTTAASLRTAEEAVRLAPGDLSVRLALVRSLLASGEIDRAEREIQNLLATHPGEAAVHVQRGVLAATGNRLHDARQAFDHALKLDAFSVEALSGVLALELNAKRFPAAVARLEARLDEGRVTPELLLLAARTYASADDAAGAEAALLRAIHLEPSLLPAYGLLGRLYLREGRLDEALREFDNLAARQSRPAGALTMSGVIAQARGDVAGAQVRYERALAADPGAAVAANNLAWIYAESGERLDRALGLAQAAAEALPGSPEVLDTLGWAYYRNNLPAMAVPPLVRCLEREPAKAVCHYHLGLAYAGAGDSVRAEEALTQALALDAGAFWSSDARRQLAAASIQRDR